MSAPRGRTPDLRAGVLTLAALRAAHGASVSMRLSGADLGRVRRSRAVIEGLITRGETAYGVNTGFGSLASERISATDLAQLSTISCSRTPPARASRCPTTSCV